LIATVRVLSSGDITLELHLNIFTLIVFWITHFVVICIVSETQ